MEQYRSPCHILYYFSNDQSADAANLKRLKKQYIAEFNLPGNTFLEISGTTYSKNDILKALEEIGKTQYLPVHTAIYQNKVVLHFLESPDAQEILPPMDDFCEEISNQEGAVFFSDLLCTALGSFIRKKLFRRSYENFAQSYSLSRFIEENQKWRLYEIINRHLTSLKAYTAHYITQPFLAVHTGVKISHDFPFLFSKDFIDFLNYLPDILEESKTELLNEFCNFIYFCYQEDIASAAYLIEMIPNLLRVTSLEEEQRAWLNNYLKLAFEKIYSNISLASISDEKAIQSEIEHMRRSWEKLGTDETEEKTGVLVGLRGTIIGKKRASRPFLFAVVSLFLCWLFWNNNQNLATLFLVLTVAGFIVFLAVSNSKNHN